jgi:hypothetical protein
MLTSKILHPNVIPLSHSTDLVSVSPPKSKMCRMKIVALKPAALVTPARMRIRHNYSQSTWIQGGFTKIG